MWLFLYINFVLDFPLQRFHAMHSSAELLRQQKKAIHGITIKEHFFIHETEKCKVGTDKGTMKSTL